MLAVLPPGVVPSDLGTGIGDKAMHGSVAAVVAFLIRIDVRDAGDARLAAGLMVGLVLAAGSIELVQPLFGRSAEWLDFVAAAVGVAVACGVSTLLRVGPDGSSARIRRESAPFW